MPTIEELDTFKTRYNELGDEPRVLEERGESLEDVTPPETTPDLELESLLDGVEMDNGSEEMEALLGGYSDEFTGGPANGDESPGIETLDDIGITEDIDEADILAATDQPSEIGDLADLGIADESAEPAGIEDFSDLGDLGIAEEPGETIEPEPTVGIDDLGISEEPGDLGDTAEPAEPAGVENLSDLGDLGDLGIAEEPTESVEMEPVEGIDDLGIAEELGEPAGVEDLSDLGDLGDLGIAEEPTEPSEPTGVEDLSDLGDLDIVGEPDEPAELTEPTNIEDFSDLGDLGDLGIAEEPTEPSEPSQPAGVEDLTDLGDLGDIDIAEEPTEIVESDAFEGIDDLGIADTPGDGEEVAGADAFDDFGLPEQPAETGENDGVEDPTDLGDLGDLGVAEEPMETVEGDTFEGIDDLGIADTPGEGEGAAGTDVFDDFGLPEQPAETGETAGVEDLSELGDLEDLGDLDIAGEPADEDEAEPAEGIAALGAGDELGEGEGPAGTEEFGDLDLVEESAEPAEIGEGLELGALDDLEDLETGEASSITGDNEAMPEFDLTDEIGETLEIEDVAAESEPAGGIDEIGEAGESEESELPGDIGELGEVEELPDIGDLGGPGEATDGDGLDIPDVGAAMEGLGDAAEGDDFSAGELILDEELNLDEELGEDVLSDMRETGEETQQFSLDDFGEQYNFIDDDADLTTDIGVDLDKLEKSIEDAEGEEKPFQLDDDDFAAVKGALADLPLNLKVAIEEMLASERQSPENVKILVDALMDGASPKELVEKVYRISRRRIELPRGYGKRTGVAFERLRTTFAYRFVHEGWPVLRIVLAVIAVTWILAMASFSFIYRPLKARSFYNAGMEAIAVDDIPKSRELFDNAWYGWPLFQNAETDPQQDEPRVVIKGWSDKEWLLRYAREYRRRKHWPDTEKMYRHYLAVSPDHKGVRLEYADFLSVVLGRYGDAVDLIEEGREDSVNLYDKDLLLALGDVYLRWGEDDPRQFENARFQYAKALEIHGALEEVTLRMLRYFLTIRDEEEVDRLLGLFSNEKPGKTRVPRLAAEVYSKVGDYYLDRGLFVEARRFVDLALAADPLSPSPWFTDARYQRMMGEPNDELNAYRQVLVNLEGSESYSNDDLRMRILTHANIGRLRSHEAQDRDTQRRARKAYLEAVELYEDAVGRNLLGSSAEYAEIFVGLGDLYYRGIDGIHDLGFSLDHHPEAFSLTGDTDMESALRYYDRAAEIYGPDRVPTETRYRRGYARYVLEKDGDYEEVLRDFHRVARDLPANHDVRYSLASVLMKRGDYEAARSQYVKTLELLEDDLRFSGGVLDPVNSPGHQDLLIRFVGTWNNLGVARARSAARTGDEESFAAALAAFARASEYLDRSVGDSALRDAENEDRRIIEPAEGRRTLKEKTTIPYLNRQYLLFPSDDITYPSGGEVFTMDDFIPYEDIPGYVSVL